MDDPAPSAPPNIEEGSLEQPEIVLKDNTSDAAKPVPLQATRCVTVCSVSS